eukprot:4515712-Prymnesium_polylepis.1
MIRTAPSGVSEVQDRSEADSKEAEDASARAAVEAVEAFIAADEDVDILTMAMFLEIDLKFHPDLLWIAKEAMTADDNVPDQHFRDLYKQHVRAKQQHEASTTENHAEAAAIAPAITQTLVTPVEAPSLLFSSEVVLAKKKEAISLKEAGDLSGAIKLLREAKKLEAQLKTGVNGPSEAVVLTRPSPTATYGLNFDFSTDATDRVVVLSVSEGSAAAHQLAFGDRLLAVDGVSITSGRNAMELIRNTSTEMRLQVRPASAAELSMLLQRRDLAEKQLHEAMCADDQAALGLAIKGAQKAGVNQTALTAAAEHQTLEMQLSSAVRGTCTHYSYTELELGTSNFSESNRIGGGGFGGVFRGVLPTGEKVAVKRLEQDRSLGEASGISADSQLNSEVVMLSRIAHEGIVRLLGWTTESVPCLVYTLMEESLESRLACANGQDPLPPYERVLIISDVGGGLAFLHVRERSSLLLRLQCSHIAI